MERKSWSPKALQEESAKVWPLLKENLCWSIGTGANIRCLEDPWIPGVDPLNSHIPPSKRLTIECKLQDMVTSEGAWNLEAFREKVLEEIPTSRNQQNLLGSNLKRETLDQKCIPNDKRRHVKCTGYSVEEHLEIPRPSSSSLLFVACLQATFTYKFWKKTWRDWTKLSMFFVPTWHRRYSACT